MKKTYQQPAMAICTVELATIMAGSITGTNIEGLGYGRGTSSSGITEGGSRHRSVWDDEDDNNDEF